MENGGDTRIEGDGPFAACRASLLEATLNGRPDGRMAVEAGHCSWTPYPSHLTCDETQTLHSVPWISLQAGEIRTEAYEGASRRIELSASYTNDKYCCLLHSPQDTSITLSPRQSCAIVLSWTCRESLKLLRNIAFTHHGGATQSRTASEPGDWGRTGLAHNVRSNCAVWIRGAWMPNSASGA